MESVLIYLNDERSDVLRTLEEFLGPKTEHGWTWPSEDVVLFIDFYEDYSEIEPDFMKSICNKLGSFPKTTIGADVRRSANKRKKVLEFFIHVLTKHFGIADDDRNDLWTLEQLLNDEHQNGVKFFDY